MTALLEATLAAAVPLWIEKVRMYSDQERSERAHICTDYITAKGDAILYRNANTAEAFNRLAEGIAILAFQPGGVKCFGMHFDATEIRQ